MKIEGLDKLHKALMELPKELHRGPLRSAVSAAAKVVQDQAKVNIRNSPSIETGALLKAVYRTRSRSGSSPVQEMQIVGVRSGRRKSDRSKGIGAPYWWHVEYGTSHMSAEPFMRPAFDTTIPKQIEALRVRLAKAIERAAAKLKF